MPSVLIKRGTRSQLNTARDASGLNSGELYLVTDESKVAVGTAVNAYSEVQKQDADLDAIAALSGTSGLLKKTAANTWTLDTTAYTANTGTVTSVNITVPTGLSVTGTPITTTGTLAVSLASGYSIPTTASQTNWDTAYTDRNKWDGGASGLVAATGRTSLGLVIGTDVQAYSATLASWSAKTVPTGDVVGTTDTQSLTNKTLTNPTVTNYVESVVAIGTVTTSSTLALANGTVQTATLTASTACTFTMPTAAAGKSFVLLLKQAASTGNGTATFTNVKWSSGGAPTITATAGKMDILTFVSDGTNWYGSYSQGYTP